MNSHNIGLLIPCTSKGRELWNSMNDTYLMNLTLKHLLLTQDKEHNYIVYIGYDFDDRIFSSAEQQDKIKRFSLVFKNVSFKFIEYTDIPKVHVTKMWNVLFKNAYDDGCDYFYQCGDDIVFHTKGWINDCINILKIHNDIGLAGPINNNHLILTQAFVSRKHMEIFGWFFPEEIINWGCDDWYNHVYKPNMFYPLSTHFCSNDGGAPRYTINNDPNYVLNMSLNTNIIRTNAYNLALQHKTLIENYLKK